MSWITECWRLIEKGRDYVYEHANKLYKRVEIERETKYFKCIAVSVMVQRSLSRSVLFRGK